ncbi:MAG: Gfo/Idh/MocA family oxidoreductase [Planctomycetes bacterium]|nr:Gfo/Idh/MocA family oxidoreductase [Planctomycetota bacterium]
MIRVGLVGAGFIGRNHFNQYEKMTDRARVVALCDADADRRAGDWSKVGGNLADAQGTKRDLGNIRPYTDWRQLVDESAIDLIVICVPTYLHRDITLAALKAGKHVLCEKPMALTVEQCDEMIAAARPPARFMIAQCIRFWPEYVWLKQTMDEGMFGPLRAIHLRRQTSAPTYSLDNWITNPELSGGAVLDLHVHDVDYCLHLLGRPRSVFAQGYQRSGGGVDRVHASWSYGRSIVVQIEAFWDLHPGFTFNMGFTAVFEDASVMWDSKTGVPLTVYQRDRDPQTPEMPTEDAYYGEINHLVSCIERGTDPTITTPRESRDAVAIALAEKKSALSGQIVSI